MKEDEKWVLAFCMFFTASMVSLVQSLLKYTATQQLGAFVIFGTIALFALFIYKRKKTTKFNPEA